MYSDWYISRSKPNKLSVLTAGGWLVRGSFGGLRALRWQDAGAIARVWKYMKTLGKDFDGVKSAWETKVLREGTAPALLSYTSYTNYWILWSDNVDVNKAVCPLQFASDVPEEVGERDGGHGTNSHAADRNGMASPRQPLGGERCWEWGIVRAGEHNIQPKPIESDRDSRDSKRCLSHRGS